MSKTKFTNKFYLTRNSTKLHSNKLKFTRVKIKTFFGNDNADQICTHLSFI